MNFDRGRMERYEPLSRRRHQLTAREREILLWVACGKTAQDISHILGLSVRTVRSHIENTREKLDANSVTHAIVKAILLGEITTHDLMGRLGSHADDLSR